MYITYVQQSHTSLNSVFIYKKSIFLGDLDTLKHLTLHCKEKIPRSSVTGSDVIAVYQFTRV